jgi:hypothetical protein
MTAEITNLVSIVLLSVASQQVVKDGKYAKMKEAEVSKGITRRVDHYQGPKGNGYLVTLTVVTPTNTLKRTVSVGPNQWMTTDWRVVKPLVITNKVVKPIK